MSLLAHGPGGVEYLCIEGADVLGFNLFFHGFTNRFILPIEFRELFSKGFIPHFLEFQTDQILICALFECQWNTFRSSVLRIMITIEKCLLRRIFETERETEH